MAPVFLMIVFGNATLAMFLASIREFSR
ncbi:hypothetical protein PY365_24785 [Roseiarcaceae bacterium H3SJ34-1]|nr:hypothetical protein [Roseiarcaceae bacterium H3SJ34-1]